MRLADADSVFVIVADALGVKAIEGLGIASEDARTTGAAGVILTVEASEINEGEAVVTGETKTGILETLGMIDGATAGA